MLAPNSSAARKSSRSRKRPAASSGARALDGRGQQIVVEYCGSDATRRADGPTATVSGITRTSTGSVADASDAAGRASPQGVSVVLSSTKFIRKSVGQLRQRARNSRIAITVSSSANIPSSAENADG